MLRGLALLTVAATFGVALSDQRAGAEAGPCGAARVIAEAVVVDGRVTLIRAEGAGRALRRGDALCAGDRIRTSDAGRAELRFLDRDTTLGITGNTTLRIRAPASGENARLETGLVRFLSSVSGFFSIGTRHANAGIDGTEAVVATGPDGTLVLVREGDVTLAAEGSGIRISAGEAGFAAGGTVAPADPARLPPAFRPLAVDPEGASDWAIYYPPIRLGRGATAPEIAAARARLDADDPDGAEAILAAAALEGADRARALALRSVIAVFRGRSAEGLALAEEAVTEAPDLAAPRVARSYALQGAGRLSEATAAARAATERAPDDPFAAARLAELLMTEGDRIAALAAAEAALALGETPLARAIEGFAALSIGDRVRALGAFTRAIAREDSAPLPRLGLGLARIRSGDIATGRRDIELAANLDPRRAVIRTWLGRAYYAENRREKSAAQFDRAKGLDPDDPTPWLFSATQAFSENRPVEALDDLETARRLGPGRAVLRSEGGLGEDRAVRSAGLGRILDTLGFEERALEEAARAVEEDPGSGSAHRIFADIAGRQDLAFARSSAELKSKLLSPPSLAPVDPALGEADLALFEQSSIARASFAEYEPFFARDGVAARLSAFGGTQATVGDQLSVTARAGGLSLGVGQFFYRTDGYRLNNGVSHGLYTLEVKAEATPRLRLFGELRRRTTRAGDRQLEFDLSGESDSLANTLREDLDFDIEELKGRVGFAYEIDGRQDLIGVATAVTRDRDFTDREAGFFGEFDTAAGLEADGVDLQLQHIGRFGPLTLQTGLAYSAIDARFTQTSADPIFGGSTVDVDHQTVATAYSYATYRVTDLGPLTAASLTGGLSLDRSDPDRDVTSPSTDLNVKAGLRLEFGPALSLRAAYTESTTPSLLFDERLEPVTVAGFAQFRPEAPLERVRQAAGGLTWRPTRHLALGGDVVRRRVRGLLETGRVTERAEIWDLSAFGTATVAPGLAASLRVRHEDLTSSLDGDLDELTVTTLGADLRYFHPSGLFAGASVAHVWHSFERDFQDTGDDRFVVAGFRVGYRLPEDRGIMTLDISNALDSSFGFEDRPLRALDMGETAEPRFARDFTAFARFTLAF
ncbi:MAG: TonB-dependent receptor domain-containing protein [Paracoccaceae bacterium]